MPRDTRLVCENALARLTGTEAHAIEMGRRYMADHIARDRADIAAHIAALEQRIARLEKQAAEKDAMLAECLEYFEERADAEYETSSPAARPNAEMRLASDIRELVP